MTKTHKERIVEYLWAIAPDDATNSQIREATGIGSHQQVYLLTQELMRSRQIRGEQRGREWAFWADESLAGQLVSPGTVPPGEARARAEAEIGPYAFEELARSVMGEHFGVPLEAGEIAGVPKKFDLVSPDGEIVGDAKYFTSVRGQRLPLAKFSVIAEHVWLLEKTGAATTFLVFGNDRRVPELWLQRYGELAPSLAFYFLSDEGELEQLKSREEAAQPDREPQKKELIQVESSMIYAVGYDEETQTLEVLFNSGRLYFYYDVPREVYEELLAAESKGRYMRACVIDVYPYARGRG